MTGPAPSPTSPQPPAGWVHRPIADDAIPALILAVLWLGGLGSLCAVICGHMALGNIRRSGGWLRGEAVAITALALGYVGLLSALMLIPLVIIG
jgi:Domain of unknown function (DUF4190)